MGVWTPYLHNVEPSNEFRVDVKLRVCWPVGEFLQTLSHIFILQDVKGTILHTKRKCIPWLERREDHPTLVLMPRVEDAVSLIFASTTLQLVPFLDSKFSQKIGPQLADSNPS